MMYEKKLMDKKEGVIKYMTFYMCLGMCFGMSGGLLFGTILSPDNMTIGMCFGISIGMCIGMAIGAAKDKRLSKHTMIISRIETTNDGSILFVLDKDGTEREYRVTEQKRKAEKFSVNDRVAEESDGSLISLEGKSI